MSGHFIRPSRDRGRGEAQALRGLGGMSPSPPFRLSLLLRSERYRRLDAKPAIRCRTDFFAAASIVTRVLAYSGATPFMITLSGVLERVNLSRARLICRGALYETGSVERNTLDFIRYEQALVQEALDRLRGRDPNGYAEQVSVANSAIALVVKRRAASASNATATFARAVDSCLERLGRSIEFSARSDREALGEELARSARAGRDGDTNPHGLLPATIRIYRTLRLAGRGR